MKIRHCTEADVDAVRGFVNLSKPLDLHTPFTYWVLLKYFGDSCFVIEEDNRVIGFISGMASSREKGVFYIWQIGVDPLYRGKGCAGLLLEKISEAAGERHCHTLHVTIESDNTASIKAFTRFAGRHGSSLERAGSAEFYDSLTEKKVLEDLYKIIL